MAQDGLIREHIATFALPKLFNALGWDNFPPGSKPQYIDADGATYTLSPVSEKKGLQVFECSAAPNGAIPPLTTRKRISRKLATLAFEHLIIFVDEARGMQRWQWIVRAKGQPQTPYGATYSRGQDATSLAQKLHRLSVTLDEDWRVGIVDMTARMQAAFKATETVTKKFYDQFRKQYEGFLAFIKGIEDAKDREWYASLMLNRLMFVYFIQSKGFLDGKTDYLRRKFDQLRAMHGSDQFYSFYRVFLLRLFHDALATQVGERDAALAGLLGDVPYLNGGLFEPHEIERRYADIHIPDAAFDAILTFFDEWTWHLDTRPERTAKEINPDVLGYIFEQFINRKQMGAYYTKEDITGYISKNTVIPWLFDAAKRDDTVAFRPDGEVWRWLQERPDAYIYPSMLDGVIDKTGAIIPLPADIAAGIEDTSKRIDWNRSATKEYALPTETWREHVARRQRVLALREKLASGSVTQINDLITDNLDIQTFAQDVLIYCESPDLLRAFYDALSRVTVLDPTCGSGAFLFAALNVLAPLYQACLDGMRRFVEEGVSPHATRIFGSILMEMDTHPSPDYFITKKIVVTNLYGVDIMPEAVEICKLRLFLKLASQLDDRTQIEPLPDIDFNIRAGNTLVGFTSIADVERASSAGGQGKLDLFGDAGRIANRAKVAAQNIQQYRDEQAGDAHEVTTLAKAALRGELRGLAEELDRFLAAEYGIVDRELTPVEYAARFAAWRASHQPFHWYSEFYDVMQRGGFDAIIGNPPYVEYNEIKKQGQYMIRGYRTEASGNLYAYMLERCVEIKNPTTRLGMIVPTAIACTDRMLLIRDLLTTNGTITHVSHFAIRPSKLFEGVDQRVSIVLSAPTITGSPVYATKYLKWTAEERPAVFQRITYSSSPKVQKDVWGKTGTDLVAGMMRKMECTQPHMRSLLSANGTHIVYYKNTGVNHWLCVTNNAPKCFRNGELTSSSRETRLHFHDANDAALALCVLNSSTFFLRYQQLTNCRDFNPSDILLFPVPASLRQTDFVPLAEDLARDLQDHSKMIVREQRQTGRIELQVFRPRFSKSIIDEIDRVLAAHYGFTDEELDFIINYDIKYRMGREVDDP